MDITIIGGTGHIGRHLVPMLVREGHRITIASRGISPLPEDAEWQSVKAVTIDYGNDNWAQVIRDTNAEVVVDILQRDSPLLYDTIKDSVGHFVLCGSIWMFGMARSVPTPDETQGACLSAAYAERFEQMLEVKNRAARDGVAFTALMEPNICGPYKVPLDCRGGRSRAEHQSYQKGNPVTLPAPGNTLIGPCDGEDVARSFLCAIANRKAANGQLFNVGAAYSLTMTEFVETYAQIHKVKIPINYVSWKDFIENIVPQPEAYWHFQYNMCPDISKISKALGYHPQFTPEQAMERAIAWMNETGLLP
ncbi:hypothetical protein BH09VER1_BH09VER1_19110 [soil metagenome]